FTEERISDLREYTRNTSFIRKLSEVYEKVEDRTSEAVFFIEQVTGHVIPDFKPVLAEGIDSIREKIKKKMDEAEDQDRRDYYKAMDIAMEAVLILADRYAECAASLQRDAKGNRKAVLKLIEETL